MKNMCFLKKIIKFFLKVPFPNKLGIIFVVIAILCAFLGDIIAPYNATEINLAERLSPPSLIHYFGTDELGRDIFSRVLVGTKYSLGLAIAILLTSVTLGLILGIIAGLIGGVLEETLMGFTNIFLAFPQLIMALAVAAIIGRSLVTSVLSLSIVFWPFYARFTRMQVSSLRNKEFIEAARCLGCNKLQLVAFHIIPNLLPLITVQIFLDIGFMMLSASSISFLGLGVRPPTPEWGVMIFESRNYMRDAWWATTFPGLAIATTCLAFNLLGDSVRENNNPLQKTTYQLDIKPTIVQKPEINL